MTGKLFRTSLAVAVSVMVLSIGLFLGMLYQYFSDQLLERAGTVFTRDQLLNTIWGYEFDGASRTVDVHIRTLRQKLGHSGDCIETVRGIGYKISTDLSAGTARNE